ETMHKKPTYTDISTEINAFFSRKVALLLQLGIKDIILDPGFGFGKSIENQYKMIDEVASFGLGKYPVLIGISRKSFIYKPLGKTPLDINEETQKLHLKVLKQGAKILRTHDVAETKKTIDCFLQN
ncbi:MAG: dihydropteroate synthase, partial [Bergeyella zoohelcum]|nr:dihydropteroate synthase [Bergeyella zoohelcum]